MQFRKEIPKTVILSNEKKPSNIKVDILLINVAAITLTTLSFATPSLSAFADDVVLGTGEITPQQWAGKTPGGK